MFKYLFIVVMALGLLFALNVYIQTRKAYLMTEKYLLKAEITTEKARQVFKDAQTANNRVELNRLMKKGKSLYDQARVYYDSARYYERKNQ